MSLAERQIDLYSRQIILRELGGTGQRRLLAGRCLLVGAGPAIETAATYLAGSGVGAIDLARVASAATAPVLAYAPLAERGLDATVRDLGGAGEIDASGYDGIVVAAAASAEVVGARLARRAVPRSGWVAISAGGASAVDLVALPSGSSACFACASAAPVGAPRSRRDAAPDPIAWSLAGALASLTILRWIAAIAPETSARAVRLAPSAPGWVEVPLARRSPCPRGCPSTA